MKVTFKKYLAGIPDNCRWGTREEAEAAVRKRVPTSKGKTEFDLTALCRAWLADSSLKNSQLTQFAGSARKAAGLIAGGARRNPRKCLETLIEKMDAADAAPTEEAS